MGYKKALRTVSIVFVCLLLVITFFSQTLADLRVPRVTLGFSEERLIQQVALTGGIVTPVNIDTFFAPAWGTIVQLAEQGQVLTGPDLLFTVYSYGWGEREYIEVTARTDRMILEIAEGLAVGAWVSEGDLVMVTARQGSRFFINAPLSPWHYFVDEGNAATIEIGPNSFTGRVERIFTGTGGIMARIEVQDPALIGGEAAHVAITSRGRSFSYTLPRSAVREDSIGYYLLYAEAVTRRFGASYYARRMNIAAVTARCARYIAFFVMEDDIYDIPFILNSDVPIYDGDRVRLVGGGDFHGTR